MSKALFESFVCVISVLRMIVSFPDLLFVGSIIIECIAKLSVEIDLEAEDEQNGRDCGHPEKRFEATWTLQPDGCRKKVKLIREG